VTAGRGSELDDGPVEEGQEISRMIAAAMDQNKVKEPEKAPSEAGSWDSDGSIVTFKP
jgi:hypothetical protein